ncbi:YT521-B-like domain-containing protein [Scleroderma yunnanense]
MAVIEDSVQHPHHEVTSTQSPSQRTSTIPSTPSAGTVLDASSDNPETGSDSTDSLFPLESLFSENLGFYDQVPLSLPSPSSLGFPSHPSRPFPPSSHYLMSSDGRLSDKSDARSHVTYPPGVSHRSSQQQPQSSVSSPSSRLQSVQPTLVPSYFPPSPICDESNQVQPQPGSTPVSVNPNISHNSAGASSVFTVSPPPVQSYPSPSPYSSRAGFGGPFTVPSQTPHTLPNPPHHSYPYTYHAHPGLPPDSGQYQQGVGYLPIVQHHLHPYYRHHSAPEGGPYPLPPHASISPQSVAGNPGPSHTPAYAPQQYQPLHYGSPSGPFAYPQHFPPGPYQWYYMPGSPAAPFNEGMQIPFPPHHPMNYPSNQPQQHRHAEPERRSGPPLERQSQVPPPQVSSSISSPQGRKPVTPQSVTLPPQPPLPVSSAPPSITSTVQPTSIGGEKSTMAPSAVSTRAHTERPLVRRPYHPNPPANRSEWVMWVGNVPGDTTHNELWRFLKRSASPGPGDEGAEVEIDGVASIFLISRSNCAFVNFDTKEHLQRAIGQFNGQQLRPNDRRCPRLVCRARRKEDDLRAGVGGQRGTGVHTEHIRKQRQQEREKVEEPSSSAEDGTHSALSEASEASTRSRVPPALLLSGDEEATKAQSLTVKAPSISSLASTSSSFLARYFPKRFFILKSLTQFDLDLSVERGLWATQKHNEGILDQAYRTSKEVILIFGVNKSGEFYGYARMTSRILRGESNISWASRTDDPPSSIPSISPSQGLKQSRTAAESPESPIVSTEDSPMPISSPERERIGVRSPITNVYTYQDRQSAPARLGPSPPREFSIELATPRFSLGEESGLRPAAPLISKVSFSAAANIPAREIVLDKSAPARAVRNKLSMEDPKAGKCLLQPVQEENLAGSVCEGDDGPEAPRPEKQTSTEHHDGSWGETFKIEWLCTERLPFQRTRHLRNAWNKDREIKVSRDGTELEPCIGQRLIDEWVTLAAGATEGEGSRAQNMGKPSAKSTGEASKSNEQGPS